VSGDWHGYFSVKPKRVILGDWDAYFSRQ